MSTDRRGMQPWQTRPGDMSLGSVTVPEQGPRCKKPPIFFRNRSVVHVDAPSDEAMTAFTLDNAQHGKVRTTSCRAITEDQLKKALKGP